jgi:colicin import membrane protein
LISSAWLPSHQIKKNNTVYQEVQVINLNNNEWKLPLNLAIGLHAMLVLTVIFMPGLFHTKPIIPEIYTVNLINIGESGPKEGGGPKQEPAPTVKKAEAAKPEVKVKPVEIKQPEPPPPPPQPAVKPSATPVPAPPPPVDAVSLAPLKRKLQEDAVKDTLINERIRKLELQQKQKQELEKKKELENIRRQRTAEAERAQRIADDAARSADELKQLIREANSSKNTAAVSTGSQEGSGEGPRSSSNNTSALESQYQAAIASRLQRFWALPEYKKWDPSLTAIIVVTINQEGIITNQFFEKRSGDKVFDQFVEKTLHDAVPLPAIPAALRKSQYEFGFRFSPTGIR